MSDHTEYQLSATGYEPSPFLRKNSPVGLKESMHSPLNSKIDLQQLRKKKTNKKPGMNVLEFNINS